MDELSLVREMWAERPEPGPDRLAPARDRLLAAAADVPAPRRPRVRRRVALAAAVVVVATGATLAVDVTNGGGPVRTVANAAEVLNRAADAAAGEKWTAPRPGQYVAVRIRESGGTMVRAVSGPELWPQPPIDEITYYQAGGPLGVTARWFERAPSRRAMPEVTCPLSAPIKDTSYAAMTRWPTDPAALRAFLLANAPRSWWGPAVTDERRLWETAEILVSSRPVPPTLRGALFRVLAGVPGVRLDRGTVTRSRGRETGVVREYATGDLPVTEERDLLRFDARTYRFLGATSLTGAPVGRYPAGTPLGSRTFVTMTVADRLPPVVTPKDLCR
jgi:hypothetical protein